LTLTAAGGEGTAARAAARAALGPLRLRRLGPLTDALAANAALRTLR
jgi:hypothetical protein